MGKTKCPGRGTTTRGTGEYYPIATGGGHTWHQKMVKVPCEVCGNFHRAPWKMSPWTAALLIAAVIAAIASVSPIQRLLSSPEEGNAIAICQAIQGEREWPPEAGVSPEERVTYMLAQQAPARRRTILEAAMELNDCAPSRAAIAAVLATQ